MSADTNRALARRYFEEFLNRGDLSVADEIFEPNVVFRAPSVAFDDVDRLKRFFLLIRKTFPDLHYVAEEGITEGDKVVSCFSSCGTFLTDLEGSQSNGKHFSIAGVVVFRIRKGRIAEVRCFYDSYEQMRQLGFIPLLG